MMQGSWLDALYFTAMDYTAGRNCAYHYLASPTCCCDIFHVKLLPFFSYTGQNSYMSVKSTEFASYDTLAVSTALVLFEWVVKLLTAEISVALHLQLQLY